MGKNHSKPSKPSESQNLPKTFEFFTFSSSQPSQSQVLQAAYMKNPGLIIDFFHKGLDLEMSLNQENWRLIHVASQTGNKDLAKFLLLKKVDINTRESSQNWTPLMVAVFNNQPEIVKLLISSKADQSLVDKDGMTALAYALQFNNRNIFKILNSKSLFYT